VTYPILAEQSVLGAIMLDASVWPKVSAALGVDDFYDADHRAIFTAIGSLIEEGSPVDAVTMGDYFDMHSAFINRAYPVEIANNTPSSANVMAYVEIVKKASVRRSTAILYRQAADALDNTQARTEKVVERVEQRLKEIAE